MSIVSTTKMTARQFLELGEDPPGVRLELVNGEVAASPSPLPEHGHVVVQLTILRSQHIGRGAGDDVLRLPPFTGLTIPLGDPWQPQ
jgi:Uma2 family endonuclease